MRPHYIPSTRFYRLNHACRVIADAFELDAVGCYLVGSALERATYRDVDVRLILYDAGYDRLFEDYDSLWSLQCAVISAWLEEQTGLPIDFQLQRMTQANAEHSGARQALGVFMDYPGERPSDVRALAQSAGES